MAFFSAPSSHPTSMMRATYSSFAMSTAAIHDEHCSFIEAASGQIVKVAAVGDPSPIGDTFGAVGPGSVNNNGKVVFLASQVGDTVNSNLFMWDNGVVTKVAALGDPAPGGGTFSGAWH